MLFETCMRRSRKGLGRGSRVVFFGIGFVLGPVARRRLLRPILGVVLLFPCLVVLRFGI